MKKLLTKINALFFLAYSFLFLGLNRVLAAGTETAVTGPSSQIGVGFTIPSLEIVLSFLIRAFFLIAGIMALLYLLLGAFAWVTSSGEKEAVKKAQDKISNAIIGLILIVAVLAIIVTLEKVVFNGKICLGISCPITIPKLIQ